MRVILAFDDINGNEASDLGDAFWLADSASNRRLAETAWRSNRYDANSAVFDPPSNTVQPADVLGRLDDVNLHHPNWQEIRLLGVAWTPELQAALDDQKLVVERGPSRITLRR
jgi:hypothetical protein